MRFYRDGLGLNVLGSFEDHEGFDCMMLGHEGEQYHLEFTRERGRDAGRAPTLENLLVFYIPDAIEWWQAVDRMRSHGYEPVRSADPYWDRSGRTFEDADGYRLVVQNAAWPK
ncbi:MAG TPA: VOC family protein [Longimicrobiaceae bacterium]|nr:VOC family protein [Longimicrobiaceae bacterium]